MKKPKYFGIDLETTGLDPSQCQILEIAVSILDEDLVELTSYDAVLPLFYFYDLSMSDFVRDMHMNSGLLKEAMESKVSPGEVANDLYDLFQMFEGEPPILAGQSVHFDHGFLRSHYRELKFHHRYLDARTVILLRNAETPVVPHRARPDLESSLGILRKAQAQLNKGRL